MDFPGTKIELTKLDLLMRNAPAAEVLARLQSDPGEAKVKDRWGCLPLHNALFFNHPPKVVTAVLAAHPAATKQKNNDGHYPLHYAPSEKHPPEVVAAVLAAHVASVQGEERPLHYALFNNHPPEVITAVLAANLAAAAGANKDGQYPLHYALIYKHPPEVVAAVLAVHPAAAKQEDKNGHHPLHYALTGKHPAKVVTAVLATYPAAATAVPDGDMGVIQSLSDKHGHTLDYITLHSAAALFIGTSAGDPAVASQWITTMLAKAPADRHVKAAVLQMLGNSYGVATGYIDAARLFAQLKAEADDLLNHGPAALHAHAVERGFAADVGPPALHNADANQAGVLELVAPWLVKEARKVARCHWCDEEKPWAVNVEAAEHGFRNDRGLLGHRELVPAVRKFDSLSSDPYMIDPACVDPDEVVLAAMCMLGHAATACLRRTHPALGAAFGSLLWADAKTFDRMRIKWKSEYASRFKLLLDFIRFSLTSPDQAAQEAFLASTREPGSAFAVRRIKSTHSDPTAQIKQCLVNLEWKPGMTFDELLAKKALAAAVDAAKKANPGVSAPLWRAAKDLLANERLRKAPVRIVIEAQLYIPFFLDARKQLHIFYKVSRAKGLAELAQDCAKYATSAEMAFAPEDPETRRGWEAAAAERLAAWAGVDLMDPIPAAASAAPTQAFSLPGLSVSETTEALIQSL